LFVDATFRSGDMQCRVRKSRKNGQNLDVFLRPKFGGRPQNCSFCDCELDLDIWVEKKSMTNMSATVILFKSNCSESDIYTDIHTHINDRLLYVDHKHNVGQYNDIYGTAYVDLGTHLSSPSCLAVCV